MSLNYRYLRWYLQKIEAIKSTDTVNVSQMSFNYRYLLSIKRIDAMQSLKIYKTYMHFCRIADYGKKSIAGTPSNLELILEHIINLAEVPIFKLYPLRNRVISEKRSPWHYFGIQVFNPSNRLRTLILYPHDSHIFYYLVKYPINKNRYLLS